MYYASANGQTRKLKEKKICGWNIKCKPLKGRKRDSSRSMHNFGSFFGNILHEDVFLHTYAALVGHVIKMFDCNFFANLFSYRTEYVVENGEICSLSFSSFLNFSYYLYISFSPHFSHSLYFSYYLNIASSLYFAPIVMLPFPNQRKKPNTKRYQIIF